MRAGKGSDPPTLFDPSTYRAIIRATGTSTALSNTDAALQALRVDSEGYVGTIHSVAIGAVVVCGVMATTMVLMSAGRTCLEKAVDQRGKDYPLLVPGPEALSYSVVWPSFDTTQPRGLSPW